MGRSRLEPLPGLADRHENVCWGVERLTELCPLESIEISHNQGVAMCVVRWSNATQAGQVVAHTSGPHLRAVFVENWDFRRNDVLSRPSMDAT
jgi:hypothetical protein